MTKKNLTKEQARLLVERGILSKRGSYIKVGNYNINNEFVKVSNVEYMIINILEDTDGDLFFVGESVYDTNQHYIKISYDNIIEIGNMTIPEVLDAYELNTFTPIDILSETNILENVIGSEFAMLEQYELKNGMKFILHNDKTSKFNNKVLTVRGVSENIQLIGNRGRPRKAKS